MIKLRQNNDSDDAYNPYDDGWNERVTGKHQSDNPFAIYNEKYYKWQKGWLEANEAIKKDEKK